MNEERFQSRLGLTGAWTAGRVVVFPRDVERFNVRLPLDGMGGATIPSSFSRSNISRTSTQPQLLSRAIPVGGFVLVVARAAIFLVRAFIALEEACFDSSLLLSAAMAMISNIPHDVSRPTLGGFGTGESFFAGGIFDGYS